jgi:DNA polymerase
MTKLNDRGFKIVMHVHDETVCEIWDTNAEDKLLEMCEVMGETVSWAPGLPLGADGYLTKYYKKD